MGDRDSLMSFRARTSQKWKSKAEQVKNSYRSGQNSIFPQNFQKDPEWERQERLNKLSQQNGGVVPTAHITREQSRSPPPPEILEEYRRAERRKQRKLRNGEKPPSRRRRDRSRSRDMKKKKRSKYQEEEDSD